MTAQLPHRPRLSGLYHVVPLEPDRVLISNAGHSIALSGSGAADRLAALLAALDGRRTLSELQAEFPDLAGDVIAALQQRGLVADAAADECVPALTGAALAGGRAAGADAARLATARVAVAGCGPVGTTVAMLLAQAGVGELCLSDDAEVTAEQIAATPALPQSVEGLPAAHAAQQAAVAAGTASAAVVASPLPADVTAQADLAVVEDRYDPAPSGPLPSTLDWGCPVLLHSQDALGAVVGPLLCPGRRPCSRCVRQRWLSQNAHREEALSYRRHRADCAPRPDAFLAAHTAVVGGIAATECLETLAGGSPRTEAAALVVELATMTLQREALLPVPDCPECAEAPVSVPE